jgi:hypothetical protein
MQSCKFQKIAEPLGANQGWENQVPAKIGFTSVGIGRKISRAVTLFTSLDFLAIIAPYR